MVRGIKPCFGARFWYPLALTVVLPSIMNLTCVKNPTGKIKNADISSFCTVVYSCYIQTTFKMNLIIFIKKYLRLLSVRQKKSQVWCTTFAISHAELSWNIGLGNFSFEFKIILHNHARALFATSIFPRMYSLHHVSYACGVWQPLANNLRVAWWKSSYSKRIVRNIWWVSKGIYTANGCDGGCRMKKPPQIGWENSSLPLVPSSMITAYISVGADINFNLTEPFQIILSK